MPHKLGPTDAPWECPESLFAGELGGPCACWRIVEARSMAEYIRLLFAICQALLRPVSSLPVTAKESGARTLVLTTSLLQA
jgi:hypothetical protein